MSFYFDSSKIFSYFNFLDQCCFVCFFFKVQEEIEVRNIVVKYFKSLELV